MSHSGIWSTWISWCFSTHGHINAGKTMRQTRIQLSKLWIFTSMMCIYIYIHMYIYICTYTYLYIYIERERTKPDWWNNYIRFSFMFFFIGTSDKHRCPNQLDSSPIVHDRSSNLLWHMAKARRWKATPSRHPFFNGIFPWNKPSIVGVPPFQETLIWWQRSD